MEIGNIIKENRMKKGLTQDELATELFVSRQLVSKWENGKSYPDLMLLIQLSDFFELSLDDLMRGDKKMTKKLNLGLRKRTILTSIIISLLLVLAGIGYFFWSQTMIQLKPEDIEITSVTLTEDPEIEVFDMVSKKNVTIPADVSYKIEFKIKKKFAKLTTGYFSNIPNSQDDNSALYVDMRAIRTLFPSKKTHMFLITSNAKNATEQGVVDEMYKPLTIKDKPIRIIDMANFDAVNNKIADSWLWIDPQTISKK